MRKALPAVILLFSLLLSSCSSDPALTAQEIRSAYLAAENVRMTVSVTADYGENVYGYKLSCSLSPAGGIIEITEPAAVAGIIVTLDGDGTTLCYDGAEVSTGAILPDGLSPIDAMPVMLKIWREGYTSEYVSESFDGTACTAVTYTVSERVYLRTWFERDTHLPVHAEFFSDGCGVIFCDFENVILE